MFNVTKKKSFLLVLILLIFLFFCNNSNFIYAEEKDSSFEYRLNNEFLLGFKNDYIDVFKSPKLWNNNDILCLSAICGGGILISLADENICEWFEDNKTPESQDVSRIISCLGNGVFLSTLIASLYATGEIFDQRRLRKTALLSLESWLTSATIVLASKFIVGRARPSKGEGRLSFHPFSLKSGFYSFPSGHTASAFAVASVVAAESDKLLVDIFVYSMASMVALSRVHNSKHWASDVFIGSALGYFVGKKIYNLHSSENSDSLRIGFQFSSSKQAFSICYSF